MTIELFLLLAVIILSSIYILWKGLSIVGMYQAMVIERLGRYKTTLTSGFHVIIPFIDKPRKFEDIAVDVVDEKVVYKKQSSEKIYLGPRFKKLDTKHVYTNDSILVDVDVLFSFRVVEPKKTVYFAQNVTQTMEAVIETNLKLNIGELTLDEVFKSRNEIKSKILDKFKQLGSSWGIEVTFFEIEDIIPPEKVRSTMEEQMKLEREKRSIFYSAEAEKKAKILRAEGYKSAIVQRAEGDRHAEILRASGVADARRRIAEAEAEAVKKMTDALNLCKIDPTQYLIATRYIEALHEMMAAKDKKVVYMPYEVSNIIGSVGGIMDLLSKEGIAPTDGSPTDCDSPAEKDSQSD